MQGSPTASRNPRLAAWLLTAVLAGSSIVFIEPAPYDVLLIALLVGLLATGLRVPRDIRMVGLCLGAFVVGNLIAAAFAAQPLETLRSVSIRTYMVLAWLIFVSVVVADPERNLPAIWRGYIIAALIAVAWGVLEYFGYIASDLWRAGMRAKGPFKDANVFGPFLVPVAVYAVKQMYATRGRWLWLYLPVCLAVAFGIFLSFSRGAWINLVLAAGIFGLCTFATARTIRERLGLLLLGGLLLLAVAALIGEAVSSRVVAARFYERAVIARDYDLKEGGRFATQAEALERIARTPAGVGPGRADDEFGLEPHNLYLHVMVEGGWLAGLGFYAFIIMTLLRVLPLFAWQSEWRGEFFVIFASLAGTLAQSLFIDSTHWRHMWLLLGLVWAMIILHHRDGRHSTAPAMEHPAGRGPMTYLRRPTASRHHEQPDNRRWNARVARAPMGRPGPAGSGA